MSQSVLHSTRVQAYRLVWLPIILVLVAALLFLAFNSITAGYSALLGGVVWLLPNLYFAHQVFSRIGTAKQILWLFYRAEIIKLLLSAILFIVVCKFARIEIVPLLIGYMAAQMMFWLAPLLLIKNTQLNR